MYCVYFMEYNNGTYGVMDIAGRFTTKEGAEDMRDYIECSYPNCYTKIKYETS